MRTRITMAVGVALSPGIIGPAEKWVTQYFPGRALDSLANELACLRFVAPSTDRPPTLAASDCWRMFPTIRRAKLILQFFTDRLGDYAELARLDLATFRHESINAVVAAAGALGACLLLMCFVCIAVLISVWDTPYRILTAWLVCVAWAAAAVVCVRRVRRALCFSSPFQNIGVEIGRDVLTIRNPQRGSHGDQQFPAAVIGTNGIEPAAVGK